MNRKITIGAAAGAAGFSVGAVLGDASGLTLARLAVLGGALAGAAIYDLEQRRIPNRLVLPASAICAVLALASGAPPVALLAGLALVGLLLVTTLVWPAALGMGDVKLTLLLVLGLDGDALRALAIGLALAAAGGVMLLARRGRAGWRTSLPLAPFLAAGALVSVLLWAVT